MPSLWRGGARLMTPPRRWRHLNTMQWKAVRSQVQAQGWAALFLGSGRPLHGAGCLPGFSRRSLEGTTCVGRGEKGFGKGPDTVSMLHDIVGQQVSDVVPERTREAADTLWTAIPEAQREGVRPGLAMDMWESYMESTRAAAPKAATRLHKFHYAKELYKAVDLLLTARTPGIEAIRSRYTHEGEVPVAQTPQELHRAPA